MPAFDDGQTFEPRERYAYGARSEAAVYVGDLLSEVAPALRADGGNLEIVALARRPGVLAKVALRARPGVPAPTAIGIGADQVAQVREQLDGERIHLVTWRRSASAYIVDALGLGAAEAAMQSDCAPAVLLMPAMRHARVLLGEIDVRGIAGWRGLNVVLASALTGWRIRLEPVAATTAWARLHAAMLARRPLTGTVVGRSPRGVRVEVLGLSAVLRGSPFERPQGQEVEVRVTRMDPDEGRIFVSDRLAATGQLALPLPVEAAAAAVRNLSTAHG